MKNSTNLSTKSCGGFIVWIIFAGSLCNTYQTCYNFCGLCYCPAFYFKELRFHLHAYSLVLLDFLLVLGSVEGGFISLTNAFKRLVYFAAYRVSLTHPGMNFTLVCLVCSGACLPIRLDNAL